MIALDDITVTNGSSHDHAQSALCNPFLFQGLADQSHKPVVACFVVGPVHGRPAVVEGCSLQCED